MQSSGRAGGDFAPSVMSGGSAFEGSAVLRPGSASERLSLVVLSNRMPFSWSQRLTNKPRAGSIRFGGSVGMQDSS